MARWKHATAILDAARNWKQRCLLEGTSVFTDEHLWTRSNFEQIHTHFVERPDTGGDSFEEKVRRQLDDAPPEAKRLWAEVTWVYDLVRSNRRPETKLQSVKTAWEWSSASLPEEHWALGAVLAGGVSHPGPDWNRWREFGFIVTAMIAWFSLPAEERESRLADPWRFAEWLDGQDDSDRRQFRHTVLFLLFPDSFERMLTTSHKRTAVKAFSGKLAEVQSVSGMSDMDLDRALLAIRERLQAEHPGEEIDFYESPLRESWRPGSAPTAKPEGEDEDESWYAKKFGDAEVWAIAPGEGARLWRQFREQRIAAIGYDREGDLGDLSQYDSRDAVHGAAIEKGFGKNPVNVSLAAWQFSHAIQVWGHTSCQERPIHLPRLGQGNRKLPARTRTTRVPAHPQRRVACFCGSHQTARPGQDRPKGVHSVHRLSGVVAPHLRRNRWRPASRARAVWYR